jgi:hypothetical protein
MTPPPHILLAFPSSDVDCERSPALDLNLLAVDHLAGVDGAAGTLGAYGDREASSDAARGDDRARSRNGPHGSDAGSTPSAEASAGRARGAPRLCGDCRRASR